MSKDYFAIKNQTDLTKERARAILPILVRQALAGQKITYGDLGDELGRRGRRTGCKLTTREKNRRTDFSS